MKAPHSRSRGSGRARGRRSSPRSPPPAPPGRSWAAAARALRAPAVRARPCWPAAWPARGASKKSLLSQSERGKGLFEGMI